MRAASGVLSAALLFGGAAAAGAQEAAPECPQVYAVAASPTPPPRVDGVLAAGEWPAEGWESGLVFPWREHPAPETSFQVVSHDGDLFFGFRVVDHDVVVAEADPADEMAVVRGDRVELFFARDAQLSDYYSVEIDPTGRVLDYRGRFYREFDWDWELSGLEAAATRRDDGYDVEARVPGSALEAMGVAAPAPGVPLRAGVFRAEFSPGADTSPEAGPEQSWISWVRPQVDEPDFHVPSAFGCFVATVAP